MHSKEKCQNIQSKHVQSTPTHLASKPVSDLPLALWHQHTYAEHLIKPLYHEMKCIVPNDTLVHANYACCVIIGYNNYYLLKLSRCSQKEMRPFASVVMQRKITAMHPKTLSSILPPAACRCSSDQITPMRTDSQASRHFSPLKVMETMDS